MDGIFRWDFVLQDLEPYRRLGNEDLRRYFQYGVDIINEEGDEKDEYMMRPKIQCVSFYLKSMGFETFYKPQIISFGPFHLNASYVQGGETCKAFWTAMYLNESNQSHYDVLDRINDIHDELLDSYLPATDDGFGDFWTSTTNSSTTTRASAWIWMLDGCSILHVIKKIFSSDDDLEKELNISGKRLLRVVKDMLLLENQIPFKLLKIICNDEAKLNEFLQYFLQMFAMFAGVSVTREDTHTISTSSSRKASSREEVSTKDHLIINIDEAKDEGDPIHLLDYLHRELRLRNKNNIDDRQPQLNKESLHFRNYKVGSIQKLKRAGIRIQKYPDEAFVNPIFDFNSGILQLPVITVSEASVVMILNLIAYEMCPDFQNNFSLSSYLVFISSLIEKLEDVKELGYCGILINELAGDEEVFDLFNRVHVLLVPLTNRYDYIRPQMQQYLESHHIKIKMFRWLEEAYNSFLRSPWTIIALLGATLGLALTFIQTWFAVHPK